MSSKQEGRGEGNRKIGTLVRKIPLDIPDKSLLQVSRKTARSNEICYYIVLAPYCIGYVNRSKLTFLNA